MFTVFNKIVHHILYNNVNCDPKKMYIVYLYNNVQCIFAKNIAY